MRPLAASAAAGTTRQMRWLACTVVAVVLLLPACRRDDPEASARADAAQAAADETAARQAGAAFDEAVARQDWRLAKAQADVLLANWPGTPTAARVRAQFDGIKAKAEAAREQARTAALWSYNIETVDGGRQLSAAIYARDDVDTDGSGAKPVRLIFRDHPAWGDSSYLVLQAGDFRCGGGCRVQVKVDDAAPKAMAATRPDTKEAIALFIEDERALWRVARDARRIAIEFPIKPSGTRTAVFEVAGLDRAKLPDWPQ